MKPLKFPMPFKECLRRVIGGRLHSERLHLFRKYWVAQLLPFEYYNHVPPEEKNDEARLNKANAMIEKFTSEGVGIDWFTEISAALPLWRKENEIQQRRNAAKTRWQKKSEKSLGEGKNHGK